MKPANKERLSTTAMFFILFCCGVVVYPHPKEIPDSIFLLVTVIALLTVCLL
jgi:hypothetical protein